MDLSSAGYVYKITNKVNGKWYIGSRRGLITVEDALNDSYMGSGFCLSKAINKYGIESFEKSILVISLDAYMTESIILEYLDAASDRQSYNMINNAEPPVQKGDSHPMKRPEMRARMSKYLSDNIEDFKKDRLAWIKNEPWFKTEEASNCYRELGSCRSSESRSDQITKSAGYISHPKAKPLRCIETGHVFPNRECVALFFGLTYWNIKAYLQRGTALPNGFNLERISREEFLNTSEDLQVDKYVLDSMTISSQASWNKNEEGSTTIQ